MKVIFMDILQVCPFAFGEVGGVSEHVRNISIRLARNHNVTAYVTDPRKDFPRYEELDGVRIFRFSRIAPSNAYYFSMDMALALRKARFDIVHGHGYHALPLHMSTLADCLGFVVTPHFHGVGHSTFRDSLVRFLKPAGKRTLKKASKIVAVADFEKTLIAQQFSFDASRITVIPNGVTFSEFSGYKRHNHNCKNILYVGNLFEYKGVAQLVEVMPRLSKDVHLTIIGVGPLKGFLLERTRKLELSDRISFLENLPRGEVLQKYFDSDLLVLLSHYEAYSLVVAEALTAGIPCVVADTSALSEWIDNETCFGVRYPIDLSELAICITNALDREADSNMAKKWIGKKIFDWNDVTGQLEDLYFSCLP